MMDGKDISSPVVKVTASIASATGAQILDAGNQAATPFADLFVLSWPNIAAMLAALYTACMLVEFCWRKFWRPMLEDFGWIKPKPRMVYTAREWAEKIAAQDSDQAPLQ